MTSNQESIEDCILQFYKNLYTQNEAHHPHPDVLNFPKFSDEKAGWLVWPFDEAEILRSLRILKGAKLLAQMIFLWLFSKLVGKLLDHIC